MFGLGFGEILIVLVLALVLLGPKKLPEVAKQLGKGLREFRKATDELKGQFEREMESVTKDQPAGQKQLAAVPAPPSTPAAPAPAATAENVPGLDAAVAEPDKKLP